MGGMAHQKTTALAVLSFQLTPGSSGTVQLMPSGPAFRSADGRPADVAAWRIDGAVAARLSAQLASRSNPLVIDYEHQTLLAEKNGQPAPAAGWFKSVEWREGQGLFATEVGWTAKAAAMIAAGEYRYISPVFEYDRQTGEVLAVRMAALTNAPGLDGMAAVALSAALADYPFSPTPDFQPEETEMDYLKKLLAALGLPADALEADALTAVAAMKAKADEAEAAAAALVALKSQAPQTPDPAKYVPITAVQDLQSQIAVLSAGFAKSEADKLIESALDDGRLNPALKAWAEDLGKTNLVALKAYVAAAQPVAALKGMQTNGQQPGVAGSAAAAGDAELAVMKQLGLSAEEFSKGKV